MKKYVLILLMFAVPIIGQEKNIEYPAYNNALKFYLMAGLPAGIGLTYTGEIRSKESSPVIHALNLDLQMIAIEDTPIGFGVVGGHFGLQYSIGSLFRNGSRFYVDLIGLGIDVIGIRAPHPFYSIKLLGFQYTAHNGFYWGIRSELTIATSVPIEVSKYQGDGRYTSDIYYINHTAVGVGAYLAIGYDFGKKINPKDYESRMK